MAPDRSPGGALTPAEKRLLTLLRAGLYQTPLPDFPDLDTEEWGSILSLAAEQGVTGFLAQGVDNLPNRVRVPEGILLTLMVRQQQIQKSNETILAASKSLDQFYLQRYIAHYLVGKGPALAAFYLKPELRECGDLDLFFLDDGEFDRSLIVLQEAGVALHHAPDGSVQFRWKDVAIDQHRRYFDLHVPSRALPRVPSPEATLLMVSAHILKHAIGPGVGLRSICDMVMACRALKGQYEPSSLQDTYRRCGLSAFNHVLYSFMDCYLSYNDGLYDDLSSHEARQLMGIVRSGGLFGHFSASRRKSRPGGKGRKWNTALQFVRHLPFSVRYAPRELFRTVFSLIKGNL